MEFENFTGWRMDMLKIGERELTPKEVAGAVILVVVVATLLWYLLGNKPKPTIGTPGQGLVLMQGGQPGAGPGQFSYPRGIAVDSNGDIYVADSRNNRIQKFAAKDWKFLTDFGGLYDEAKASNGDAKKLTSEALGKMHEPNGVAIGPNDNVYVIDTWNNRIQIFSSKGGSKAAYTADDGFFAPREIAVDPTGVFYVADTGKHRIVKFDKDRKKVMAWGMKGDKEGQFNEPIGLAIDQGGNVYVADRLNFRIQVFSSGGQFVRQWKVKGWSPDQIDMEPHLALDQAHGLLYATDGRGKKVYCYKLDGTLVTTLETNTTGAPLFYVPIGVAVDKDGNIYVVDAANARILKLRGQF
jgi:DNA-binding beta-propeller fold protein YncE